MKIVTTMEVELELDDLVNLVDQVVERTLSPALITCEGLTRNSDILPSAILFPIRLKISQEKKTK
ncbi:MAG: hypothetical protein L0191_10190 [Acidobacteria bacterium]|nr:hypothetical protein [Acidobacteriota bacterium]